MPTYTVTDWENGPMGPGFFILFPRHEDRWYDGGIINELIDVDKDDADEERRVGELFALIMLMR